MTNIKHVVIIPAREGSRSIADKNIRTFAGKPLIAWTIEQALEAKNVDRVIVSTDSEHIADIARKYSAEVPFLRPSEISDSDTAIEPVLLHAYQWLRHNEDYNAESMVLLFPTNPLRASQHIDDCIELFISSKADSVISVHESPAHYTPYWTLVRDDNGVVSYFGGQDIRAGYARRQDFPQQCFAKNDLVFVVNPENLFGKFPSLYGERVELYITDRIYDGDINDIEDWDVTLQTFRYLELKKQPGKT